MDKNQNSDSFLAKLKKWLSDKAGKIQGEGGNALKAKILRFESLEERQLLAADSGFGGLGDLDRVSEFTIFPQPGSYYETAQIILFSQLGVTNPGETVLVSARIFVVESSAESRSLAILSVCERYLQEGLDQSEFVGLEMVGDLGVLDGSSVQSVTSSGNGVRIYFIEAVDCSGGTDHICKTPYYPATDEPLIAWQCGSKAYVGLNCAGVFDQYEFQCSYLDATGATVVENGVNGTYWRQTSGFHDSDWTWTLPVGMTNAEAQRDFTFTLFVSLTDHYGQTDYDSITLDVHVAYAEIVLQFAGEVDDSTGETVFAPRSTAGGQTAANTVVVGQKVHAKVETSSKISVTTGSVPWGISGGIYVKDDITDDSEGRVVNLTSNDLKADELEFYYVTKNLKCGFGYVGASACFTGVNGNSYNNYSVAPASSFYIEAPTNVSLSAVQTGTVTYRRIPEALHSPFQNRRQHELARQAGRLVGR